MAEAEQNFVEHDEQQNFSSQDSDQHHLAGNEFDQHNMSGNVPGEYFDGNMSENQGFTENEPQNDYGAMTEQHYPENETEQSLDGDQGDQDLTGNDLKQEVAENVAHETDVDPDNSHSQKRDGHENNLAGGAEKKWPGWPGESVFRMLVPAQKVGNIIGRKGEYIKKIVEETKARIKILDGPPGSQERAVSFYTSNKFR